jgi:hypothetical protein
MTSDDVTAWASIAFGAAVSVGATALLLERSADPGPPPRLSVEVPRIPPPPPVIDFAIIRSPAKVRILVGPEGPHTGWVVPRGSEMRWLPSR